MASAIDPTHPVTGQPVSKAKERANWQAAKDEIEALQAAVGGGVTVGSAAIDSNALTLDAAAAGTYAVAHNQDLDDLTITNWPAAGTVGRLTLYLTQDATGDRAAAAFGDPPFVLPLDGFVLATAPDAVNVIAIETIDAGATVRVALTRFAA